MKRSEMEAYFYNETKDLDISDITLMDTKHSYLWKIKCYRIETKQSISFYLFDGDTLPVNLYPIREEDSLDECYYMHIGLMTELCSRSVSDNFIVDFLDKYSISPILDRRITEIRADITLNKNASQLSGIANQIRDCYLTLTDYLLNRVRTQNPSFKNDNFTDNLEEFLRIVIPGSQSETRRSTINGIAKKGWKLNSELIHKDSTTIFDIMTSLNVLKLIISTISNLIVGNNMPFNKIKCPNCQSENYTMVKSSDKDYRYVCQDCKTQFSVALDEIIKKL